MPVVVSPGFRDNGTVVHPKRSSGARDVVIGDTVKANADIILNADGSAVFNEQGSAVDFRVEGASVTSLLDVQGAENQVGIGTSGPTARLHVNVEDTENDEALRVEQNDATNDPTAAEIVNTADGITLEIDSSGTGALIDAKYAAGQAFGVNTTEAVFNDAGADQDFRVESSVISNSLNVDGGSGLVSINQTGDAQALEVINAAAAAMNNTPAVKIFYDTTTAATASYTDPFVWVEFFRTIDQATAVTADNYDLVHLDRTTDYTDGNGTSEVGAVIRAFTDIQNQGNQGTGTHTVIVAEFDQAVGSTGDVIEANQNGNGIVLDANAIGNTTANAIDVVGSALTTGSLARFYSNSSDASARNLVEIVNDHADSSSTKALYIDQDSNAVSIDVDADNTTANIMVLESLTQTTGNNLQLIAPAMTTGFYLQGTQNSSALTSGGYASFNSAHNADLAIKTGAYFDISPSRTDTGAGALTEDYNGLQVITSNESDNAGSDYTKSGATIYAQHSSTATQGSLTDTTHVIETFMGAGNPTGSSLKIDHNPNSVAVLVDSDSTTSNTVDIQSNSTTEGNILNLTSTSGLTTGRILNIASTSADAGVRTLINVTNQAGANSTNLSMRQEADSRNLFLNQDGEGIALEIDAENTTANIIEIEGSPLTSGAVLKATIADTFATGSAVFDIDGSALDTATDIRVLELSTTAANDVDVDLIHIERGANDAIIRYDEGDNKWQLDQGTGAGFVDITTGAGGGTLKTIKEADSQVGDSDIEALDFDGDNFNLTEAPDTEIQVSLNSATTTTTGGVELATAAETTTGTDTGRAITPDGLAGSDYGKRIVSIKVIDDSTTLTTGDGKLHYFVPAELNGFNIVGVSAGVSTVSSSGTPEVQIHNLTDTVDVLSTTLTIDANEKHSSTAATAAVINAANDDVATGDELRIDVDTAGTGAKGLQVDLVFQLP